MVLIQQNINQRVFDKNYHQNLYTLSVNAVQSEVEYLNRNRL